MKTVTIRNLVIGGGKPKVCVPMMGDEEAVLRTAEGIKPCRSGGMAHRYRSGLE